MKIGIILGSIREGRKGKSVADWVMGIANERTDAEYVLIDLAQFDLPLLNDAQVPALPSAHDELAIHGVGPHPAGL